MSARLIALTVTVASVLGYHIAQRSVPAHVRPTSLFGFVYSTAALAMLAATLLDNHDSSSPVAATRHWAPWLLTASVLGIELGVLAMYRSGWALSTANITTQTITAIALVGIGAVMFSEAFTPTRAAGAALCLAGAWLISH